MCPSRNRYRYMRLGDKCMSGGAVLKSHMTFIGPLFVTVGYGLIVGIAFVHFTQFLPGNSPFHLVLSILLASELLLQYSLAIWSDPGYVDPEHLDFEADGERYCEQCNAVKPLKAHHCRECRRCVYEMDHHCTWINNCVGYYNYRHFWLLLMYIWVSCFYVASLSFGLFIETFNTSAEDGGEREKVVLHRFKVLFSFMATSVVGVVICCYWMWHAYLVLTEQSTIEFMQREERIPLRVTAASVRHALGRLLGRQDVLWFVAFVVPSFGRKVPPKYVLKSSSNGPADV